MAKKNKRDMADAGEAADAVEMKEAPEAPSEELMDFESWYAERSGAIPAHHRKEIIKADFAGRKVPDMATMAQFDDALKKYGVELA
jgi:hypothetical protein